ncbi:hypothetical protein BIZ83_gp070 [Erwinia phage vB_EamM_ChrisDB]|uniref:hypothetical protein n=1 Tax=Erwinia phage vB_EamM_ChrisDB TaxID=1883371 RepID=UPI00081C82C4|nr:hypothetical protein BIZ83_gp070 [Erwinia phage vB_EamM_ChrisDB]ANZ48783.1 hypothetical protein CHRISDB_221 [Erwinia phage vB_EamM_ChrisDB]
MSVLPDIIIDKIIAWTPTGNAFRGKLMTRYLFWVLLAFSFPLMVIFWFGLFGTLDSILGRPVLDDKVLPTIEVIWCTPFCAFLLRGWLKRSWAKKSILTTDDVYSLIGYGKELIKTNGKKISWSVIVAGSKPVTLLGNGESIPRFPTRVRSNDVIGGILCAMYQEGGWSVLPKEAWSFFNEYPFAFRAFYSNYR